MIEVSIWIGLVWNQVESFFFLQSLVKIKQMVLTTKPGVLQTEITHMTRYVYLQTSPMKSHNKLYNIIMFLFWYNCYNTIGMWNLRNNCKKKQKTNKLASWTQIWNNLLINKSFTNNVVTLIIWYCNIIFVVSVVVAGVWHHAWKESGDDCWRQEKVCHASASSAQGGHKKNILRKLCRYL